MYQLIFCADDTDNGLYRDGVLIFYGGSDYLDCETVMNLAKEGVLNGPLTWYELTDESIIEEYNGYPQTFDALVGYIEERDTFGA